jgi:hypothetical protein
MRLTASDLIVDGAEDQSYLSELLGCVSPLQHSDSENLFRIWWWLGCWKEVRNFFVLYRRSQNPTWKPCFLLVLNGNVAAVKSVVSEITDDSNKALAFSFLPVFAAVGGAVSNR